MYKINQILRFLCIIIFVVFVSRAESAGRSPIEIQLEESNSNFVILKLEVPDFKFDEVEFDGQKWQTISFPGCAYTYSEGEPKLPIKTTLIGIPPGAEVDLQLLDSDYTSRKISRIVPVKDVSIGVDNPHHAPRTTRHALRTTHHASHKLVELGFTGYIRDSRVIQVRFNPVQYNSVTNIAELYHKLRAKVIFRHPPGAPSRGSSEIAPESKVFTQMLKRNILNYDVSKKWQRGKEVKGKRGKGVKGLSGKGVKGKRGKEVKGKRGKGVKGKKGKMAQLPHYPITQSLNYQSSLSNLSPTHSCKIYIDEDGIYSINYDQLKEVLSKELEEIDPHTFKVYNKGKQIPIFVRGENDGSFDENDEIIFYGVHNRGKHTYYDRYSVENVYWLYWTGMIGTRMIEHKVDYEIGSSTVWRYRKYKYLTHIEKNNIFVRLPQATDGISGDYHYERSGYIIHRDGSMFLPPLPFDNWYWAQIGAPNLKSYSFELPDVAETSLSASVRVSLRGRTDNPADPDHHIQIWLNGEKLLEDVRWDGQELHLFNSDEISQDYLVNGTNKITIISPGDTQAKEIDQVLLDWIEVEYWREYKAVDNFLEFSMPVETEGNQPQAGARAVIYGFSTNNIEIYGTDGTKYSGVPVPKDEENPGKYKVIFRVPSSALDADTRYIALSDTMASDKFKEPKAVVRDEPSYLRSSSNGADYIIITHDDFVSGVKELAELRVSQGLRVAIVTTQNIYDEFNHGIFNPYAIRDFLIYAYENWSSPAPSFVTLVGDTKRIKPAPSEEDERDACVPTILVRSNKYGAIASDYQFSLLRGEDALPDIVVSRLPVNNMIELSDTIEKVIAYEKHKLLGPWRKRLLSLAGVGQNFSSQSDSLIKGYVPQPFEITRIYSDDPKSPYYGETMDVIDEMSSGNSVVSFIGHGGGGIWSDNRMMGLEDVELLENKDSLSFILSMTCFTGYFNNQYRACLGEKMLRAEKKGATGFLGATGLGWVYGDYFLAQEMFDSLFAISKETTIGSIVTDAKIDFISRYPNYIDIANMFTLFGDSAQTFEFPKKAIDIQSPGAIESNEVLDINGSIACESGNLEVIVSPPSSAASHQEEPSQITRITTPISGKHFSLQTQIPPTSNSGTGIIKAYAWNESTDAIGSTTYSIGLPHVSNIYIEPSIKLNSKSYLYAEAYGTGNLSLWVYWTYNTAEGWTKMPMNPIEQASNLFRTNSPLPSDNPSAVVYYYLELTDGKERTVESQRKSYRVVTDYCDLTFTPEEKIRWITTPPTLLSVEVKNAGIQPAENIVVRFYDGSGEEENQIGKDQVITMLKPDNYAVVQVPWEPEKDQHTIFVKIDPAEKIREQNEDNNVISEQFSGNRFPLTPKKGSNGAVQSIDRNLTFNLAGGKIQENALLEISNLEPISLVQPDLKYAPLPENSDGAVYNLALASDSGEIEADYELSAALSIKPDLSQISNINDLMIQWYDENTSKWVLAGKNSIQNDKIETTISSDGFYALMESNDQTPPEIEITTEHQAFIPGSYVSENPVITVGLRDENGIDIRENSACEISERLVLLKDQTKVDRSEYSVSASPTRSGLMFLTYSPNLGPGQHTLTVQAFDSSGNLGENKIELNVAGELEIEKVANYPNPIKDEGTTFAYILTKDATKVSLKIYTGTGRLVKSFDYLYVFADYNEFFWNGLDEDGEELPNGVYFYKMKAELDDKVAEKVGKLAILR